MRPRRTNSAAAHGGARKPGRAPAAARRLLAATCLVALSVLAACGTPPAPAPTPTPAPVNFDGARAYEAVLRQVAFGPRPAGSQALAATRAYITGELARLGWAVEDQEFVYKGVSLHNVVGRKGQGAGPVVILGAHYDTRLRADRDPVDPSQPVPGANDGASGTAVLLELARSLDMQYIPYEVWLAFFDAEDNGDLDGWEWLVGSTYLAEHLTVTPAFVVVVDMVGDSDQQLYLEQNSTPAVRDAIWATAAQLGYARYFIAQPKWAMIDDHTPFLKRGSAAVDIIDFDYPAWHTGGDTADKVSGASLERVGRTLETYLETNDAEGMAYP